MKDFQQSYSTVFRRATRGAEQCPPGELLATLAAGRAWPWQRRRLVDHLGRCSDCADDYRVLATARGGLVTALGAHAGQIGQIDNTRESGGFAPAWLRPGLAAAALAVVAALGVSVLVQTGGPWPSPGSSLGPSSGPFSASTAIVANRVEPRQARGSGRALDADRVFKSDFGGPESGGGPLFRDDFGG